MSGVWGNNIKLSIFGESHGEAIGITLDGLPSGFEIDLEEVDKELERRAPGRNKMSTARKEGDRVQIVSGFFNGRTTGTPLCGIIKNEDKKSRDYSKLKSVMRPGHGDYPGYIKYNGFNDYRGGGHFSGRITAPVVFAGALLKQILRKEGIEVFARIKSIGHIEDKSIDFTYINKIEFIEARDKEMAVLDDEALRLMKERILEVKEEGDSIGGVVECVIVGLKGGIGSPFFNSIESNISQLAFSVPGVKGIEFGAGFEISKMKGSESNDTYYLHGNDVKTRTNNNGGITGGISNGMPIVFRCAIKPTSSIYINQDTIDIETMTETNLQVVGRHDPCIVQRALPVIEAIAAIGIYDLMKGE